MSELIRPGITVERSDCTCGTEFDAYCPRDGWRGQIPTHEEIAARQAEEDAAMDHERVEDVLAGRRSRGTS